MVGTTNLNDLPNVNETVQEQNIQMDTREKNNENVVVENKAQELEEQRNKDLNQFVAGIQKASKTGSLSLPSRDIPIDETRVTSDEQVQPNHIPKQNVSDYITEHQTTEEIIRQHANKEKQDETFDKLFDELSIPILVAILYFIFQLPVVKEFFLKTFATFYTSAGDMKLQAFVLHSVSFGAAFYVLNYLVKHMNI